MHFPTVFLLLVCGMGVGDIPEQLALDFRSGNPLPREFAPTGARAAALARAEKDGLRIVLSPNRKNLQSVGLVTKLGFHGDFEITAGYEILKAEIPATGYGVGVMLTVKLVGGKHARVGWVVRGERREVAIWDEIVNSDGNKPVLKGGETPFPDRTGRLRLRRKDEILEYFVAKKGEDDDFKLLHTWKFGKTDVKQVGLIALTGKQPVALDARWLDLRINSESTTGNRGGQSQKPIIGNSGGFGNKDPDSPSNSGDDGTKNSNFMWYLWFIMLVVTGAVASGSVLLWRRSRKQATIAERPTVKRRK